MKRIFPERYMDIPRGNGSRTKPADEVHFWSWQKERNVADRLKHLSDNSIITEVEKSSLPFSVFMSQVLGDFNFSSVVRSANFLGAKEIFYRGRRKWNRIGAVGSYLYKKVTYLPTIEALKLLKTEYKFVALENNIQRKVQDLPNYTWEPNSMILIGEEGLGLSDEILDLCDDFVEITNVGSVRSLNAAVAGSIAMYDYISKLS